MTDRVASRRFEHSVTVALQDFTRQRSYLGLVLDEQDRLRAWYRRPTGGGLRQRWICIGARGQINGEYRARAGRARHRDRPGALGDDAEDGRQPEPRPPPGWLRREKWLEDPCAHGFVHAVPTVRDLQRDVAPRLGREIAADNDLVELDVRGRDRDTPTVRHGVARVHYQIQEHLLDLGTVGHHAPRPGAGLGGELHVLADEAPQHRRHVAEYGIEVEPARLQHLLATEREELAGERGRAASAAADDVEIAPRGILRRDPPEQEVTAAIDDGHKVVEVVGNPAREASDRFHLLRLSELGLEARALRHVDEHREDRRATAEVHRVSEHVDVGDPPVLETVTPRRQRGAARGRLLRDLRGQRARPGGHAGGDQAYPRGPLPAGTLAFCPRG